MPVNIVFFGAILNKIILLIFSECLLQVYENTIDFPVLMLYSADFLNWLSIVMIFFVAMSGFPTYKIMSSMKR